jgi:hypothetical protein
LLVTSSSSGSNWEPSSLASESRRSVRRAAAMTRCPSWTNLRAIAAPKPELAPVTSTIMKNSESTVGRSTARF